MQLMIDHCLAVVSILCLEAPAEIEVFQTTQSEGAEIRFGRYDISVVSSSDNLITKLGLERAGARSVKECFKDYCIEFYYKKSNNLNWLQLYYFQYNDEYATSLSFYSKSEEICQELTSNDFTIISNDRKISFDLFLAPICK